MPSGAGQLIQTILTIRGLQQQDAAAQLAREQFGLTQAATGEQMLGHIGTLASSLADPTVMLPHVKELEARTGIGSDILTTIFSNATPGADVTKGAALARGVKAAGPAIDQPAAYAGLVGAQPGALGMDAMNGEVFKGAQQYITSLPPEQRQQFNARVAERVGSGEKLGEVLNDEIFAHLPSDQQQEAIRIGKGLSPSADATIQGRLGAGNLVLQQNIAAADAAYKTMMATAAMSEANARLQGKDKEQAQALIKQITDYQEFLTKNSGTFTELGQKQATASMNAMIQELRQLDPHIGGLFEPIGDVGKPLGATGPGNALMNPNKNDPLNATSHFGALMQNLRQKP